jgi:CPA1 family monovalent cation:H+ antiporter
VNISNINLLLIACVIAIVSRRTRVPYTVGLVLTGLMLAYFGADASTHLSHELIFHMLLPPLIFEAAFQLKWRDLKSIMVPTLLLATVGVIVAAASTAGIIYALSGLSLAAALTIGIVLSATDPVSVLALLKEAKLPPRIHKLLESESLLNDGTASILFALLPLVLAGTLSPVGIATTSLVAIAGGLGVGALVGIAVLLIAGRTQEQVVEIAMTVVAAYASFYIAESVHASGILSTLSAGMVLANLDRNGALTHKGLESAHSFWEFACFVANSFIFILIGIDLELFELPGTLWITVITIVAMLIGRALCVYLGGAVLSKTEHRVPSRVQHLLVWGGLRGALSIALALSLPTSMAERGIIITVVFHAVVFSIIVQGLTVGPLIARVKR